MQPIYLPALVIIISVPMSWKRFHRSDPCRSTRVSSPAPFTGAAHSNAGCGLSSSASSLSAAPGNGKMRTFEWKRVRQCSLFSHFYRINLEKSQSNKTNKSRKHLVVHIWGCLSFVTRKNAELTSYFIHSFKSISNVCKCAFVRYATIH